MGSGGIKGKSNRSFSFILDVIHVVICLVIILLAVLSFLNAENNLFFFPVVFMLAAFLNLLNGWVKIKQSGRDKRLKFGGAGLMLLGAALVVLAVVSAFSIWR